MRPTLNTILIFFLAFVALAGSRALTSPSGTENFTPSASIAKALTESHFSQKNESVSDTQREYAPLPVGDELYVENTHVPPATTTSGESVFVVVHPGWDELIERNESKRRPIASITKLVTAAVTLDHSSIGDTVFVSQSAVETEGTAGSLLPGEERSVEDLLAALLIESSNDAAAALAEHVSGGNIDLFVNLMNRKATEIGLLDTFFADPAGLRDDAGYSTARDIAQLVAFLRDVRAYRHIWRISSESEFVSTSNDGTARVYKNTNPLVSELQNIEGSKTGYTTAAGESMVIVMSDPNNPDKDLIFVLLGSANRVEDMRSLIEWTNSQLARNN